MDRETLPTPDFSRDEMLYLQELVNNHRCELFDEYMNSLECSANDTEHCFAKYQLARSIRDKVYHMTGRDTLALGPEVHEQRWWDQGHDYR